MPKPSLPDPAHTQIATLAHDDNPDLKIQLADKCASAAALGYQLVGSFPHLDRLVLVFQKPLPR